MFTLVANVTLEGVQLHLQSPELTLSASAFALVHDQDEQDQSQHGSASHRHSHYPVVRCGAVPVLLLILEFAQHIHQVADTNLHTAHMRSFYGTNDVIIAMNGNFFSHYSLFGLSEMLLC